MASRIRPPCAATAFVAALNRAVGATGLTRFAARHSGGIDAARLLAAYAEAADSAFAAEFMRLVRGLPPASAEDIALSAISAVSIAQTTANFPIVPAAAVAPMAVLVHRALRADRPALARMAVIGASPEAAPAHGMAWRTQSRFSTGPPPRRCRRGSPLSPGAPPFRMGSAAEPSALPFFTYRTEVDARRYATFMQDFAEDQLGVGPNAPSPAHICAVKALLADLAGRQDREEQKLAAVAHTLPQLGDAGLQQLLSLKKRTTRLPAKPKRSGSSTST